MKHRKRIRSLNVPRSDVYRKIIRLLSTTSKHIIHKSQWNTFIRNSLQKVRKWKQSPYLPIDRTQNIAYNDHRFCTHGLQNEAENNKNIKQFGRTVRFPHPEMIGPPIQTILQLPDFECQSVYLSPTTTRNILYESTQMSIQDLCLLFCREQRMRHAKFTTFPQAISAY